MRAILLAGAMAAVLVGPASATGSAEIWKDASQTVTKLMESRAKGGFEDLGELRGPQVRRIEMLLDEAVGILSANPAMVERRKLAEIRAEIGARRKAIADLRFAASSAPKGSEDLLSKVLARVGLGERTKESYAADIAAAEAEIAGLEARQKEVTEAFAGHLEAIGIRLTAAQVDGLMAMATAEDIVGMQAVFENLKAINRELLDATIRSDESLEVARRYYGIYTVMLEVALYMHDEFIDKVEGEYLAGLDGIEKRAGEVQERTRRLLKEARGDLHAAGLKQNLAAQDLTLRTARLYRERLEEQRRKVMQSAAQIRRQHDVAVNTYQTVQLSSDLVAMMRSTGKSFEALMSLEIPAMRPFESLEMQAEFEKITTELKGAPTS